MNEIYGRWTVLSKIDCEKGEKYWRCKCECGRQVEVAISSLKLGKSTKCIKCKNKTHGLGNDHMYSRWYHMIARCNDPEHEQYEHYGARGITVCSRWMGKNGLVNFVKDVGSPPFEGASMDRENNDKGYYKENVRWATSETQIRNRQITRNITYRGKTKTITEWCELKGLSYNTVWKRLKQGWTVHSALNTPAQVRFK